MSARSLIVLAFNNQPDIKSSYQQFKAEEARYDFFYTSNDALTPRFSSSNTWSESRAADSVDGGRFGEREREHFIELGVDKHFFDTTKMSISTGLSSATSGGDWGNQPYVAASVRYPLWGSRKKLERTSEDIFRRNELNDAQLNYIKQVRWRLQDALMRFYTVIELRSRLHSFERWRDALVALTRRLENAAERDFQSDRRRIEAELVRVNSEVRKIAGRLEVDKAWLKFMCGLPYETVMEIDEAPFNPFEKITHAELLQRSIEVDPEIATLQNAKRNAEVQLDLARRGQWDVALLLDGRGDMRGRGVDAGATNWELSAGLEVSAIDARVTGSLQRQARANIERFSQAIVSRQNSIYAATLEPLIRIETLGASRDALTKNLHMFHEDYHAGVTAFIAGELNIDNLLKRRELTCNQEQEIGQLTLMVGINVAELCTATGKFFELIDEPTGASPAKSATPTSERDADAFLEP